MINSYKMSAFAFALLFALLSVACSNGSARQQALNEVRGGLTQLLSGLRMLILGDSRNNPKAVIRGYYDALSRKDAASAYDYFSEADRALTSRDAWIKYMDEGPVWHALMDRMKAEIKAVEINGNTATATVSVSAPNLGWVMFSVGFIDEKLIDMIKKMDLAPPHDEKWVLVKEFGRWAIFYAESVRRIKEEECKQQKP
jgi:hypothetical protein